MGKPSSTQIAAQRAVTRRAKTRGWTVHRVRIFDLKECLRLVRVFDAASLADIRADGDAAMLIAYCKSTGARLRSASRSAA